MQNQRRGMMAAGVLGALALGSLHARADTVIVNVFSFDYSTGLPDDPIMDPVINVGDTVRWEFLSPFHSTTSVSGIAEQWDSGLIFSTPAFYEHTFTQVGSFEYYCIPHGGDNGDGTASGMAGVITVVPAPGAGAVALVGLAWGARRRR
jgi:hypothetical protein